LIKILFGWQALAGAILAAVATIAVVYLPNPDRESTEPHDSTTAASNELSVIPTTAASNNSQSLVRLQPFNCDQALMLSSTQSVEQTQVTFTNDSKNLVKVFWVKDSSQKDHYFTLSPGQKGAVDTWATHVWEVQDDSGTCQGVYVADREPGQVHIR
jgi:hypothetical protein